MVVLGCMLLEALKGANTDSGEELIELEGLVLGDKGSNGKLRFRGET